MHALLCALLPALVIKTCLCVPDPPAPSSCGHGHDTTPHPASSSQRHSPAQRPDFRDVPLTPAQASFDQMRAASNGVASRSFGRASAVGLHHAAPHHAEAFPCPGPNVRSALRRPRPLLILSPAAPWAPEPPGGIHRQQREPENKKKDHVHSASCVRACLRGRVGCTGPTCQPGGKRCEQKRPRSARDWPCRARHAHTPPLSPFTRLPEAPSVAIQDISTNRRWCLEQGTNDAK